MSEKGKHSSRFFLGLMTISMFLLIISSTFLLQFNNNYLIPSSVFKAIIVNNTSVYITPNTNTHQNKLHLLSSVPTPDYTKKPIIGQMGPCQSNRKGPVLKVCDKNQAVLRVYLYDLPPEFHFGLLGWKGKSHQIWPDISSPSQIPSYPGGLNLQHSMEYWLTLDLLSSNNPNIIRPCTAIRVNNSSQADIIFVPFFSSLSYNRHSKVQKGEKVSVNRVLQEKLVNFLINRDEWKKLNGKDHLIVAHHPNSMLSVRRKLGSSMFVLADFGRYPIETANLDKDVIAPYKHVVRTVPIGDSAKFEDRPILVYFQGAIYRKDGGAIRQDLYYLLKDEKDVHFAFGSVRTNGIKGAGKGMSSSKFCLNIAGDTPSSNRLFDAIASHCVPVIISDQIELPFEDVLDYTEFSVFVRGSDAVKKGFLLNLLRGINREKWTKMWEKLKQIEHHFEYQYPSSSGDAVSMIWEAISRKVSSVRFKLHRKNRYRWTQSLIRIKNGF